MTNLELMLEICQHRKADAMKLFTEAEIELFDQGVRQAVKDGNKIRGEELAEFFIRTFNQRVSAYNDKAEAYNKSIYNGTHPALGGGIFDDTVGSWWRDIKSIWR